MAIEIILEAGIVSFGLFLIAALVTATIIIFGMAAEALQRKRTSEMIWSILGFFFLVSVLLITVGALVFALTA